MRAVALLIDRRLVGMLSTVAHKVAGAAVKQKYQKDNGRCKLKSANLTAGCKEVVL